MDVYSGVRWSAASKYGAQGMQVVVSLVLARLLVPEFFGLLGMAEVIMGFAYVVQDLGLQGSIIQRKRISDDLISTLFWVNLAMCLLLGGVMVGIAPAASWMYQDPQVAPIVAVLTVNFVFAGFTMIPSAMLTRQMAFKKLAVREITSVLVSGAASITLALLGWGVWALVAGSLAGSAMQMILINFLCPFRPRLAFDREGLRECLGFGLNLTGFSIFNYFARNADKLIIGAFLGPVALGYYALAYKLMLLPRDAVTNVVSRVLFPAFSRMQNDDARLKAAYLRACGAIAFVTFPMMFGLLAVARPFVEVVLGDKWLPAVPLICVLATVGMLQSLESTIGNLFLAKGRADLQMYVGVAKGTILVCSFLVGILWGIEGVVFSYALTNFVLWPPTLWIAFRLVDGLYLRDFLRVILHPTAIAGIMALLVHGCLVWLDHLVVNQSLSLLICVSFGGLVYGSLVLLAPPPASDDLLAIVPVRCITVVRRLARRRDI